MTSPDLERIYDVLQRQNEVMHQHGVQMATLVQESKSTNERLFGVGTTPGIFAVVARHHTQLGYMKGAAAILSMLWAAAIAIVASLVKGGHH